MLYFCKKFANPFCFWKNLCSLSQNGGKIINKKFILKQLRLDFIYKRCWVNSALTTSNTAIFVQNISFSAAINFFQGWFHFQNYKGQVRFEWPFPWTLKSFMQNRKRQICLYFRRYQNCFRGNGVGKLLKRFRGRFALYFVGRFIIVAWCLGGWMTWMAWEEAWGSKSW